MCLSAKRILQRVTVMQTAIVMQGVQLITGLFDMALLHWTRHYQRSVSWVNLAEWHTFEAVNSRSKLLALPIKLVCKYNQHFGTILA